MIRLLIILFSLFLIKNLPATEQEGLDISSIDLGVWERADGPFFSQSVLELYLFNNSINITSFSYENTNFTLKSDNWEEVSEGILSECGRVYNCVEKNNVIILSTLSGIYISYNKGSNWKKVESLNGSNNLFSATIVDETIFAQVYYLNSSLYKLEKNSNNWEKVFINENKDSIFADRITSFGNYIIAGDFDKSGNHKTGGGITISSDKGKTWNKLTNFQKKIHSVIIYNGNLFVGANDRHLYKSSNYGKSWEVDTNKIFPVDMFYSNGVNLYAAINSVSYQDGVPGGIHLSTDNGLTWERRHDGIGSINVRNILSLQDKLYCLDDDATVYESENKGQNWVKSNILTDSSNCLDVILYKDTLFAGVQKEGLYYSIDEGASWDKLNKELSVTPRHLFKNGNIFAAILSRDNEYIISSDGGKNWKRGDIGGISVQNPPINDGIVYDDKFILATDMGLKYTSDLGENWIDIYGGELDSGEFSSTIYIDRFNNQDIFYTWTLKGLLKSNDKGKSWEPLLTYSDLTSKGVISLIKIENGYIYGWDNNLNILRTKDEGKNWSFVAESLTGLDKNIDIFTVGESLVAVVAGGIAVSNDGGKSKEEYYLPVKKLNGNPFDFKKCVVQGNYIIAATEIGILRAKLTDIGITPTSVESETERNYLYTLPPYPLPAKSEVKVQFYWDINLPMTIDDISIYDLNGREIQTKDKLRIDKQANHYGNLTWDCSNEQAGIYIINIKHGTEERAVKVVVE